MNNGDKRYKIMVKQHGGWWDAVDTIWGGNAEEAAERFIEKFGMNPPEEFAIQSTTGSSAGVFKIFRVKRRRAYDLEVV